MSDWTRTKRYDHSSKQENGSFAPAQWSHRRKRGVDGSLRASREADGTDGEIIKHTDNSYTHSGKRHAK
ncbi:hypothetical protein LDENG_00072860 [Lucifuga dentata]|nr:hypothetical protein LDENG_00072860 [Lucifuga dentata]